jgi:hypothetical protein
MAFNVAQSDLAKPAASHVRRADPDIKVLFANVRDPLIVAL